MRPLRQIAAVSAVAAAVLASDGCSASISTGGDTVSKEEVAKEAQAKFDAIARSKGQAKFPPITCPSDLDAKKGASERCSATGDDGTLGITVTVTGVDGGTAHLHFQGDSQLTPSAPATPGATSIQ